jgi:cytochrome bd-type quinol oxidase subunit 2
MRPQDWEYLAYVLVGVGATLSICGATILVYVQEHSLRNEQYGSYPVPLLLAGAFFIAMTALAIIKYKKRKSEELRSFPPSPPPPQPPPPPPPACWD